MKFSQSDLETFAAVASMCPKLREVLKKRFDDYVNLMVQTTDQAVLLRAQGRAAEVDSLIQMLDSAKDTLQKLRAAR